MAEHSNILRAPAVETPAAGDRIAWWLWPNVLSLDAPAVAVVWLWAFAEGFGVAVEPAGYAVLFLTVWLIYAGDRLIDVFRDDDAAEATTRHHFTKAHFLPFAALAALAGFATVAMAFCWLPAEVLHAGMAVAFGVGVYFGSFVLAGRHPGKEFACGVLFAAGVAAPLLPALRFEPAFLGAAAVFGFFCALNCRLISAREDGSRWPSAAVLLLPCVLCLWPAVSADGAPVFAGLVLAAAGLFWLRLRRATLPAEAFRVLADAVLLAPAPVVLFWRIFM